MRLFVGRFSTGLCLRKARSTLWFPFTWFCTGSIFFKDSHEAGHIHVLTVSWLLVAIGWWIRAFVTHRRNRGRLAGQQGGTGRYLLLLIPDEGRYICIADLPLLAVLVSTVAIMTVSIRLVVLVVFYLLFISLIGMRKQRLYKAKLAQEGRYHEIPLPTIDPD